MSTLPSSMQVQIEKRDVAGLEFEPTGRFPTRLHSTCRDRQLPNCTRAAQKSEEGLSIINGVYSNHHIKEEHSFNHLGATINKVSCFDVDLQAAAWACQSDANCRQHH